MVTLWKKTVLRNGVIFGEWEDNKPAAGLLFPDPKLIIPDVKHLPHKLWRQVNDKVMYYVLLLTCNKYLCWLYSTIIMIMNLSHTYTHRYTQSVYNNTQKKLATLIVIVIIPSINKTNT